MKVNVTFETKNSDNEIEVNTAVAVLDKQDDLYRLVYVEDLSGFGKKTKSVLTLGEGGMQVSKNGEIISQFVYEKGLIHNSIYKTVHGSFPVSVITKDYVFKKQSETDIEIFTSYELCFNGTDDGMPMEMKIKVSEA